MRLLAALLVAVLLLGSVAGVGVGQPSDDRVGASGASPHSAEQVQDGIATNDTSHDGTTIRISVRDDGDARWNVTTRFALRNENETAAFRQLGTEYESGETDVGLTRETIERIENRATVDRETAIESVERSARLRNNSTLGVLTLSFTWTNFTRVEDDQLHLGDAFRTESGTWLPVLNDKQTLIIEGPDDYVVQDTPKGVKNFNEIHYEGPQTFEPGEITVVYAPRSNTGPETTPGDFPDLGGVPGLLLVLFVVGGLGAYAWTQRREDPDATGVAESSGTPPSVEPSDSAAEPSAERAESEVDGEDDEEDVELLSDEERVLRLLRKNDGRMKQADIVSETNWSNAKVSQLLSKMDERGQVDKLRIGRENLITLPDEDVTDVN